MSHLYTILAITGPSLYTIIMSTVIAYFILISAQFNLPPNLLSSLCYVESTHNIEAIHYDDGGSNSVGICQIKLRTAQNLGFEGTEQDLMDPYTNIYYAAKYLSHQHKRYHGNIEKSLIAYNMGSAKDLTTTPYSAKVLKIWAQNEQTNSFNTSNK